MNLIKKNTRSILNIFFLFLVYLLLICVFVYFYNKNSKEGLEDMYINNSLSTDFANSFCAGKSGNDLKESCLKLTQDNCLSTSCCIWTSNEKCAAGNKDGLLFRNDESPMDYYYFKDTCYGNCK